MSEIQVLADVRMHLLTKNVAPYVHLALPPKALYPLILLELEELWSPHLLGAKPQGGILGRIKFKASAYSQSLSMDEVAHVSVQMRKVLEGVTLGKQMTRSTVRFLSCVAEIPGKLHRGQQLQAVHHFYDALIREVR